VETKAKFVLMGLFALAVTAGAFWFVYWLQNFGGFRERAVYRVRFESSVGGLITGAAVLFNGIRVGDVSALTLSPSNPLEVVATIGIDRDTPVRADTRVGLDYKGMTGVPAISMIGGTPTLPPLAPVQGQPPVLVADTAATQDMTETARQVLRRLDTMLAENATPLSNTMKNLGTFTDALARNSDRIDGIVSGLERMTGGGPPKAVPQIYDLVAPTSFPPRDKAAHFQLVVAEPTALLMFDTQKILVRPGKAESPSFDNAQWSDSLPKLLQAKIIQSFENANYVRAVARPMDGLAADFQLLIEIRRFQISTTPEAEADVEFAAKVLGSDGRIVDSRTFHTTAPSPPLKTLDAPGAAAALNNAFDRVAVDLVVWTASVI